MKRRVIGLVCFILCMMQAAVLSAASADQEEARMRVLTAVGCMASYEDRCGLIAEAYLAADGWSVDRYVKFAGGVSADFLVARKRQDGTDHFLLAAAGTSDIKDVRLDLKMKQVPYGGDSLEEARLIAAQPVNKEDPDELRVHKGFNKLVDVLLTVEVKTDSGMMRPLIDILRNNEESTVYLTGHSLGGAAVTIMGARLRDLGIAPKQIRIMTFGAPAVGNEPFARAYADLPLERITLKGDPIVYALQKVAGGYEHFGTEKKLDEREDSLGISMRSHAITSYFDVVLKDHYDLMGIRDGAVPYEACTLRGKDGKLTAYVVPMKDRLDARFDKEKVYMHMAMADSARMFIDGLVLADTDADWEESARAAGCRYVIFSEVTNVPLKQSYDTHYIVYSQTVYDIREHRIVSIASYSTDNRRMTTYESFLRSLFDAYKEQKNLFRSMK